MQALFQFLRAQRGSLGVLSASFAAFGVLTLSGCGGGDTTAPTVAAAQTATAGRAVFTVRWPQQTRLIPFAADSIVVRLTRGGALLGQQTLHRPQNGGETTAVFERIAPGDALVSATAFPTSDGTGVAQARAEVAITVVASQTVPVRLTLASTIDRMEITPANPAALAPGATVQLAATAKNAAGEVVITNTGTIQWSSDSAAVATVQPGGLVTAVAAGRATIKVTETESGKVGNATITVSTPDTDTVKCDSTTGHCYEKVTVAQNQVLFDTIRAAAEQRTYSGMKGHLATLTSQAELDFVAGKFDLIGCTIGAYQDTTASDFSEPNGGWRWITGETWQFTAWNSGEPNNVGGGENFLNFYSANRWNDVYNTSWNAYLVEYEPGTGGGGSSPDLLVYDGFDYPAGAQLENQNGGTGWARGWNQYGSGYTPSTITEQGLTYGRLQTSGRATQTTSFYPIGHARIPSTQLGTDGTILYGSALVRPLAVSGGYPDSYFGIGFSDMGFGKPGNGDFYSIEKPSGATRPTSVRIVANQTVFLVYRVTFRSGVDKVELWVNPEPGQPLPAPQAVKEDVDVSLPGDFGIGSSVTCIFDEYRLGKTWESVSPVTP